MAFNAHSKQRLTDTVLSALRGPSFHHHQSERGSQPCLAKVTEITKKREQHCSVLEQQATGRPPGPL